MKIEMTDELLIKNIAKQTETKELKTHAEVLLLVHL
jgi:hypothetical protein